MKEPKHEQTFVMVKPDGVKRGLIGEIIGRLEQRGLKIVAIEMFTSTPEQAHGHYPTDPAWIERLGEKTMKTYNKYGYDAMAELGTTDKMEIGKKVREWLMEYLVSAPMVRMVVEGVHAIEMVRKLAGNTIPSFAEMGTIRGDYSIDSAASANREQRAIFNLVHASETPEEAAHEIKYWFGEQGVQSYNRTDESVAN